MEGMPEFSDMNAAAVQLHEMFQSFVYAGFTESQAMQIVCTVIETQARSVE